MRSAQLIVSFFASYAALGGLFALFFAGRGVQLVDPAAHGAGLGFRLLIMPGTAALWPWLAWRWWRGLPPPLEKNAHRQAVRQSEEVR